MKKRALTLVVLLGLSVSEATRGTDVRMTCTSVRGGGVSGCETSVEQLFDFALPFTYGITGHLAPVIRLAPSLEGASVADEGFGRAFFFREAFVEKMWGEVSASAGIKKVSDPIAFDFMSLSLGKKADGRDPFAVLKKENALGTPGVYVKMVGEWTLEIGIIASPAGTFPGKTGSWSIPLPSGYTLREPDSGGGGLIGALYGKIADVKVAVMAGSAPSNTATRITTLHISGGGIAASPFFDRQDVFALSAEKSLGGNITVRSGVARHGQDDSDSFTRGGIEAQKIWEWPNKTNLYVSCGLFAVRQEQGSSVDLNRALTNHGACKVEYEEGRFVYGATFVRGLDHSGYIQGELRYDAHVLAKTLGVKDAELSIQASKVDGGDGSGSANIFQTYADRKTVTVLLSFSF